ncbi:AfsR/SARP family transcriptional regulator [Streptomyces sudanensis]|uniref:AfsR/SARP family transcriptional regulator n=1 Tax=Streptomyces sudanensis TaxID=436397 RepID=UPI0020CC8763|nr:transcriptional regulator [Streptomyces sudanensis]MCP9959552.1 transcriptional regulator [Streptomyces sudanensis]MCQ0000011.1 transcriptional regulator [Streptomyces sudanensis]
MTSADGKAAGIRPAVPPREGSRTPGASADGTIPMFTLLGPVGLRTAGGRVLTGPGKRAGVLAVLLLHANRTVSPDLLTGALWDEEPPRHSRTVVQGHISRIRAALAEAGAPAWGIELATLGGGYELRAPGEHVDSHRFAALTAQAREADAAGAAALLRRALGLWHGAALAGTSGTRVLAAAAQALEDARLTAVENLGTALLRSHSAPEAVALLHPEAAAHPLRESLLAVLLEAMAACGQRSSAIEAFHRTRRLLKEELGVEPGPALRGVYADLLGPSHRAGGAWTAPAPGAARPYPPEARRPAPAPAARTAPGGRPDLLPRPPAGFIGRVPELRRLTALTTGPADDPDAWAPPVVLVTGPAGVGKTSLALRWAHLHAARHPDGCLFADLRGFSANGEADGMQVLRMFLHALGVPAPRVPDTPRPRRRCTVPGSRTAGCSSYWTTRATPRRYGRCSPPAATARHWSPAATASTDWSSRRAPSPCGCGSSPPARGSRC